MSFFQIELFPIQVIMDSRSMGIGPFISSLAPLLSFPVHKKTAPLKQNTFNIFWAIFVMWTP